MSIVPAAQHFQLGMELARQGQWEAAAGAFCQAVALDDGYAAAYTNLGYALYVLGQRENAEVCLRRSIELDPHSIPAHNNLGLVLMDEQRSVEAVECFQQALVLSPACAEVANNLALAFENLEQLPQAEEFLRKAVQWDPEDCEAWYNLGRLLKNLNRLEEAEEALCAALHINGDYGMAAFALASLQLLQGRFAQGWARYDRLRMNARQPRFAALPRWQGEALQGQRVLLFQEQGFGDTLQFVRYVRLVAEKAAAVEVWVQPPLVRLLRHSLAPIMVHGDAAQEPGEFDLACPIPSLPCLFKTEVKSIPTGDAYLEALPPLREKWRQRKLAWGGGYAVGIVWAGNPRHHNDHNRSVPFTALASLFDIPGICWVSLQEGVAAKVSGNYPDSLIDYSAELTDFAETAGIIDNLDLVITVDSAVAHLAGAMGKPVWMLVPFAPDWRWLLEREDSPWYSSMRLFRQSERGDWAAPVKKVREALQRQASLMESK